jgi:hypothetical protein
MLRFIPQNEDWNATITNLKAHNEDDLTKEKVQRLGAPVAFEEQFFLLNMFVVPGERLGNVAEKRGKDVNNNYAKL